ncbi:MAG: acetyl-CoA carboxylase biotin carboxylase subunit [Chloroflexi bacterium]|nr:acetyl-CoA carboxylase biotin carboxylase subunit [Chloroflexota bacterium]
MFKKVLIANRGEIALRVIRACQELGVSTVAVYSEADRNALHVRYADEAYLIGPPPSRDSYLRIDKIIEVARRSGADAIHPGYGFLAENPDFPRACREAEIVFVGPPPEAITAAGNKLAARLTVRKAGVPVISGTQEEIPDDRLVQVAQEVGYPLFVKAVAGGGGKGLRLVAAPEELPRALAAAHREAEAAFGYGGLYIEKVVENARHVEFQVLADAHGNFIHLGERECSLQRRHQKLVEEAPSVILTRDEKLRARMGEAAIKAAKAAGYVNAGTIEFLLDKDKNFYFLEMNTRLQVEHPVTEMVTGIDIVKEQLRIASGKKLRYKQKDIRFVGHAIECRISAEDPFNKFLPSAGRITSLREPTGPGVRVESGVYEGMEISLYYDPLVAKLVVWGDTRAEAILRMRRALEEYQIVGVKTSIPFHRQLLDNTSYQAGHFDTRFVEERFVLSQEEKAHHGEVTALVAALIAHHRRQEALALISPREDRAPGMSPWKLTGRREAMER